MSWCGHFMSCSASQSHTHTHTQPAISVTRNTLCSICFRLKSRLLLLLTTNTLCCVTCCVSLIASPLRQPRCCAVCYDGVWVSPPLSFVVCFCFPHSLSCWRDEAEAPPLPPCLLRLLLATGSPVTFPNPPGCCWCLVGGGVVGGCRPWRLRWCRGKSMCPFDVSTHDWTTNLSWDKS